MTWTFSAEEWLVDFNSAPRGVARSGQSLDPIDEQLRQLLPWIASEPQLVMPSIVPKRPKPEAPPPPAPPAAVADDGLEIELHPTTPAPPTPVPRQAAPPPRVSPAREENAPQPPGGGELSVFIPTLTRGSGPVKAKEPVLEIGIPGDDDDADA
ncbi:MAG: hypothetical protein KC486_25200, partial [Myxococcales bacterium]|nr:hypothetical protein [Myxococcales bacterium]